MSGLPGVQTGDANIVRPSGQWGKQFHLISSNHVPFGNGFGVVTTKWNIERHE